VGMNTPSLTVPGRTPINHNLNPNRKRRYVSTQARLERTAA